MLLVRSPVNRMLLAKFWKSQKLHGDLSVILASALLKGQPCICYNLLGQQSYRRNAQVRGNAQA